MINKPCVNCHKPMNGGVYKNTNQCPHCFALQIPTQVSKRKSSRTVSKHHQKTPIATKTLTPEPITSATKPAAAIAKPATKPTAATAKPATKPTAATTKSAAATTKPATKPEAATAKSATAKSATAKSATAKSATKPAAAKAKPATKSAAAKAKPATKPVAATTKSAAATAKPATKPVAAITKSAAATAKPVTKPVSAKAKPVTNPAAATTKSAAATAKPATKPVAAITKSAAATAKPATKPVAAITKSAAATAKPVKNSIQALSATETDKSVIKKPTIARPKQPDPSLEATQKTPKQHISAVAAARAKRMNAQSNTKQDTTIPVSTKLGAQTPTSKSQAPTLHRQSQTPGEKAPVKKEASHKLINNAEQKTTSNPFLQARPEKPQQSQQSLPKTPSKRASIAFAAINKAVLMENERSDVTKTKKNH